MLHNFTPNEKQRKSPENGDWKRSNKHLAISQHAPETKKVSWKWRLKVDYTNSFSNATVMKQRKSPENGDWKWILFSGILCIDFLWNKESLLKMEIESNQEVPVQSFPTFLKQRKSPENGDWKTTHGFLVREEPQQAETKKVSWKWRLKDP